jgi:hypothetical protein
MTGNGSVETPSGDKGKSGPATTTASSPRTLRSVAGWIVLFGAILLAGAFIIGGTLTIWTGQPWLVEIAREHFAATVGLPAAALVALCIVYFLEHTGGPIEFEGLGFKFRGASGPIVLWVLCFLAITAGIRLLW